ncbi:MAG: threonine synthase [Bacteroidota bacterium]
MAIASLNKNNPMPSFITHLESAIDGTILPARQIQTMHAGRPLWVRYDLDKVKSVFRKEMLLDREPTMWRYRELLPLENEENLVSLGEGMTPLLSCQRLGAKFGLYDFWIKDEGQLPTGSFKSRGLAAAITMANEFGVKRVAIPTAGNAGGAMAAYAARANMEAFVFMPADTPMVNQLEAKLAGAKVFLVNGLINDCGKFVKEGKEKAGWFDVSTLKEPYRIEGKKTMGFELAEQFNWELPDVILYPTGGGTGLIGMWKAFKELREIGWLNSDKMPKMVAVQSDGCCPMVKAFEDGKRFAELFENAESVARGIRVPGAVGDFMILDTVRESGGKAIAVEEGRIGEWMKLAASNEGISVCPEAAACIGAAEKLSAENWIKSDDRVVVYNCGAAQKNMVPITADFDVLQPGASIDWEAL